MDQDSPEFATQIRDLWENEKWAAAFAGLNTYKNALKTIKNITISEAKLKKIMQGSYL